MAKKKTKADVVAAAAIAEASEETSTYDVLSNLKHDGKLYRNGSTVELTATEAAAPLKHKAVKLAVSVEEAK